jgi:hypothetical protein
MWSNQENRVRKQVKNPCEARKIKASQNLHKIISTHLLTLLIIRAIVQLEQKRGVQREQKEQKVECSRFSKELPIWSLETAKLRMKNKLEK